MKTILKLGVISAIISLTACQAQTASAPSVPVKTDVAMALNYQTSLITKRSAHSVEQTIDRLETAVKAKGLRVFARIDHQANAAALDLTMPASTVLIFGSPKIGSPLMNAVPTIGIDLPVKALAYEAADGRVYLSYNNPAYLKTRHNVEGEAALMALAKMTKAAAALTQMAVDE
ncbi:MAG: DUF302 domain-containing protein [Robiginitomaculum sp.]